MIFQTMYLIPIYRPFVEGDTATYLRKYFNAENIPVFEETFCSSEDLQPEIFNGDLDVLLDYKEIHKGHLISLWPWGYKVFIDLQLVKELCLISAAMMS